MLSADAVVHKQGLQNSSAHIEKFDANSFQAMHFQHKMSSSLVQDINSHVPLKYWHSAADIQGIHSVWSFFSENNILWDCKRNHATDVNKLTD